MTVSTRVQPIDRSLVVRLTGTDEVRSALLADFARKKLAEAEQINLQALGHVPAHETFVDGSAGTPEDRVKPDGVIVYEFQLVSEALAWIAQQLAAASPIGSGAAHDRHPGLYQHSHLLFADGAAVDPEGEVPSGAGEYVFIDSLPYSRKIEAGESRQAPDGVYEAIATLAQRRFGESLNIRFTYRGALDSGLSQTSSPSRQARRPHASRASDRQPAIVITVK